MWTHLSFAHWRHLQAVSPSDDGHSLPTTDSSGDASPDLENAPIAFLLTVFAGFSTCIGASFVYLIDGYGNRFTLTKEQQNLILAGGLSIAAGVMLYISLVEILMKSVDGYLESEGRSEKIGWILGYVTFFGGVIVMHGLDRIVEWLKDGEEGLSSRLSDVVKKETSANHDHDVTENVAINTLPVTKEGEHKEGAPKSETSEIDKLENIKLKDSTESSNNDLNGVHVVDVTDTVTMKSTTVTVTGTTVTTVSNTNSCDTLNEASNRKSLHLMGLKTALAIALHNAPEGLATFVATLEDVSVGLALAIGIAIHNVPEGLCVAIPIYYANLNKQISLTNSTESGTKSTTGNCFTNFTFSPKNQAFFYAALSGLPEPITALVCWLILAGLRSSDGNIHGDIYGILFGLVAGMMVFISVKELIPTALRHDPKDVVVSKGVIIGMAGMGLSLVLMM